MGAKTWMLIFSNGDVSKILKEGPTPDKMKAIELVGRLFPSKIYEPIENISLLNTSPSNDELSVGCYPGLTIVASSEFAVDYPSKLDRSFLLQDLGNTVHLHAMHSVVDWFAFAVWQNNNLIRSLSVSPDGGLIEDLGDKMEFEKPYWAGHRPAVDPEDDDVGYPLPFHPLVLGEEALAVFFGYQLEGHAEEELVKPEDVVLHAFREKKTKWKFW